jgi:hypothetical protein
MRHLRSRALIVAVAAMVSSGCFGSFQAVRTVYSWNKSFGDGNKWAQELMYIVIGGIVPVYGVAGFLDAVVLNSIEFWTGKNPMTASTTKSWEQDGKRVVQTLHSDKSGRTEIIQLTEGGKPVSTVTLFQPAGATVVNATTAHVDGRIETKQVTLDAAGTLTPQP